MKYAWIENQRVRETTQGNPNELYHPNVAKHFNIEVPDEVQAGWYVNDGQYLPPEPEQLLTIVPGTPRVTSVTPRQARLALALQPATNEAYSNMLTQIQAVFDTMPEPQRTIANITWEYSMSVDRDNPFIAQLQDVIGITDEQIDMLFVSAAAL